MVFAGPRHGEAECHKVTAPWPDPSVAPTPWSDPVLQALYDAVHAVALTVAGATSFMHEAKVDVVTVPNLSEHLSSAETTNQLSARFGYAAAMKSINNLLLLGDGETWNRQTVDFAGLPEMVRTFLQVAAGAADIPVTRLIGQSPAGLSATGESDTRNYYHMIAARQELELRPALERLDRVIAASEGIDPGALDFAFRPLWQLDAATAATIALQKAQATQVYAGLKLWPAATTARLVEAQLADDGTYPNAQAVFGEGGAAGVEDSRSVTDIPVAPLGSLSSGAGLPHYAVEPHDWHGRWTRGGGPVRAGDPLVFVNGKDVERKIELEGTGGPPPALEGKERTEVPDPFRLDIGSDGRIHLPSSWAVDPPAPSQAPVVPDPRAAQKLDNALSDYQTRRYTVGDQTFQFDKSGMRDVLQRHAPEYWDGVAKDTQTFFPQGTSIEQLQDVVRDVLSQNREAIVAEPSQYRWRLEGTSGGIRYEAGIYQGRIRHLVPLK